MVRLWRERASLSSLHGLIILGVRTHTHTHLSCAAPTVPPRRSDLSQLCCNSSLLFNKQFVSDVLNAGSNLIVCAMCMEVAARSPPLSLPCSLSLSILLSAEATVIF